MSETTKLEGFVWPAGLRPDCRWAARDAKCIDESGSWFLFTEEPQLRYGKLWGCDSMDDPLGIDIEDQSLFPVGDTPLLLFRDDYVQPVNPPHCDICHRGVVDFAAENLVPTWHTLEEAGCEVTLCQDCWANEPIGWRVFKVGDDGSVLLQAPNGARRRYVFLPHDGQPTGTEARVCADIAGRQQAGLAKYGTSVESNPLTLRAWLVHAYQECLDQAVYLKRAIEELDKQAGSPEDVA